MENQHRKISGYRELSAEEIELMNRVKAHADATGKLIAEVHQLNSLRFKTTPETGFAEAAIATGESNRWAAVAKTQLQQGFMALVRGIALPSTF